MALYPKYIEQTYRPPPPEPELPGPKPTTDIPYEQFLGQTLSRMTATMSPEQRQRLRQYDNSRTAMMLSPDERKRYAQMYVTAHSLAKRAAAMQHETAAFEREKELKAVAPQIVQQGQFKKAKLQEVGKGERAELAATTKLDVEEVRERVAKYKVDKHAEIATSANRLKKELQKRDATAKKELLDREFSLKRKLSQEQFAARMAMLEREGSIESLQQRDKNIMELVNQGQTVPNSPLAGDETGTTLAKVSALTGLDEVKIKGIIGGKEVAPVSAKGFGQTDKPPVDGAEWSDTLGGWVILRKGGDPKNKNDYLRISQ